MGILARTGEWAQTSIANIISNEVYLGKIRWRREPVKRVIKDGMMAKKRTLNDDYKLYEGLHEAIITQEQWNLAKAAQEARNHTSNHTDRQLRNPFAGVLMISLLATRQELEQMQAQEWQILQAEKQETLKKIDRTLQRDGSVREKFFFDTSKMLSENLKAMENTAQRLERRVLKRVALTSILSGVLSALACGVLLHLAG